MSLEKATTQSLRKRKGGAPIVACTAYDAIFARLADEAGVDLILVGDSVGNTVLGFESTVPVTLDMMVHHSAAVARARPQALLVADVPFALAHADWEVLRAACVRLMQEGGAEAVKLEGGEEIAANVARLVAAGIPVLGHIGLLPQRVHALGGYRSYGRTEAGQKRLLAAAQALEAAGAFSIVGEMIQPATAKELAAALQTPLIGIGCGADCDGQILVSYDLLGLNLGRYPSFVGRWGELAEAARTAFTGYAEDVRARRFPAQS